MWGDDGIVHAPARGGRRAAARRAADRPRRDRRAGRWRRCRSTSLFSARFRECAARALLLPRRRPDQRTPLWQQRQRAADLLAVAAKYPTFPILLETSRECLQDVFDVPALARGARPSCAAARVRVVSVDTPKASPFAQSLLFNWIAAYMYEGDAPLAERRAAALALDRDLLRELLGAEELRELLDAERAGRPRARAAVPHRRPPGPDRPTSCTTCCASVGDLTCAERRPALRGRRRGRVWSASSLAERRAIEVRDRRRGAVHRRRGRGPLPRRARLLAAARPAGGLHRSGRRARSRSSSAATPAPTGRSSADDVGPALRRRRSSACVGALRALEADGPAGARRVPARWRSSREWCDVDVLRQLRRRSLAALRREVEPVEPGGARPVPARRGTASRGERRGLDALVEALGVLQGAALVACTLETDVLPLRVRGYRPADLDELCTSGELVWLGAGASAPATAGCGCTSADQVPLLAAGIEPRRDAPRARCTTPCACSSPERGACFWSQLRAAAPGATDAELLAALWDLVWAGEVTNDSLAPLRAVLGGAAPGAASSRGGQRPLGRPRPGRLTRLGPPPARAVGRWWRRCSSPAPPPTEAAHAAALQLLERHGVLTREAVLAEGVAAGSPPCTACSRCWRSAARCGAATSSAGLGRRAVRLPGAVDRLRSCARARRRAASRYRRRRSCSPPPIRPSRTAPRCPGPSRPAVRRAAPARWSCCRSAEPLVWFDRRAHHLVTFPAALDGRRWVDALGRLVKDGRCAHRDPQDRRRARARRRRRRPAEAARFRRRLQRARCCAARE